MNTRTKRIVFVTGYKGGTGRTTFARGLLDIYQHLGMNYQAYDTDRTNPQLHRHYPEAALIDLTRNPVQWANEIEETKPDVALIDMSAGSGVDLNQLMQEWPIVVGTEEMGYRLTFVSVIGRNKDSQNALQVLMDGGGNQVDYVAVKNRYFGDEEEYGRFNASYTRAQLLELNGREIWIPRLFDPSYDLVDEHDLAFRAAAREGSPLTLAHRSRVHQWLKSVEQEIDKNNMHFGIVAH
jgi:hypothetical protein